MTQAGAARRARSARDRRARALAAELQVDPGGLAAARERSGLRCQSALAARDEAARELRAARAEVLGRSAKESVCSLAALSVVALGAWGAWHAMVGAGATPLGACMASLVVVLAARLEFPAAFERMGDLGESRASHVHMGQMQRALRAARAELEDELAMARALDALARGRGGPVASAPAADSSGADGGVATGLCPHRRDP